ncbi:MAG: 16S rRNA (uracil(1498)-N(3))-methyltransferase [Desulfobacteraceae bacterium]|nr:16S rRNA (uracil(1498)-N(3))-methyltransferase [Desulfobacteraceae bacterium]
MKRFFVEEIIVNNGTCSITGQEAKHISKVLRMGTGDRLILSDRKGARFLALILSVGPREVLVALEKSIPKPSPSPIEITLCQAMIKSRQMDYVIQKTSELGVDRILPFSSKRTVVRLSKDRLVNKIRHWHEIAQSSTKQSDRDTPAEIGPVVTFEKLMERCKGEDVLKVILWEEEGVKDLKSLLREYSSLRKFVGIVGPEGGFIQQEVEVARDAGFISVSLGSRILRSETAAITMVAIAQYEWGDLSLNVS